MTDSTPTASAASDASDAGVDRRLLAVSMVVVMGAIMSILDVTVVNVAIDTLSREFKTSLATIQWVATGYTLALATVIPMTGWAADRFGTKRLYMISIALFMCGSALSGLAWSSGSLIGFRVLQGLGGGMIMPAGMTILTRAAGPARIGRVMSIVGVPMLLGPVIGPILGGWLVDAVSWRWIFFINIPIGVIALVMALRILPRDQPAPQHRFDFLGMLLLSPGLAAMIYGLAQSNSAGGFGHPKVLVPLIGGIVLLAIFVWHALRKANALIDLRLFTNRTFAAASGTLILFAIAAFGSLLLLPLYLQVARGESALTAGLLLAPQGLGAMVAMPIAGMLVDRTGAARIVLVGLTFSMLALLGLTQLQADTSYWLLSGILVVFGLGMGGAMMPTFSGAMKTLRQAAIARASTSLNIIQQVGASIGTAVLSVVLASTLAGALPGGGGNGLGAAQNIPDDVRARIAPTIAGAFGDTFWWAVGILALAFLTSMLLPWHKQESPEEGDEEEAAAPAPMIV